MEMLGRNKDGSFRIFTEGLEWTVPDDMENRHRRMIAEWESKGNTLPVYEPEPEPEAVIIIYPADLWRRVTDEEADGIAAAMNAQPLRIRKIFETAQMYRSDDELWSLLHGAAVALFGEERAGEILAPSEG